MHNAQCTQQWFYKCFTQKFWLLINPKSFLCIYVFIHLVIHLFIPLKYRYSSYTNLYEPDFSWYLRLLWKLPFWSGNVIRIHSTSILHIICNLAAIPLCLCPLTEPKRGFLIHFFFHKAWVNKIMKVSLCTVQRWIMRSLN